MSAQVIPSRLRAPFPYFGSKYDVADVVWEALGDPANYIEPFAGSLAVLLGRPRPGKVETVNDYADDEQVRRRDRHDRHAGRGGAPRSGAARVIASLPEAV